MNLTEREPPHEAPVFHTCVCVEQNADLQGHMCPKDYGKIVTNDIKA